MFKEFKEFAMRGNVVDMAVGTHHWCLFWDHRQIPCR